MGADDRDQPERLLYMTHAALPHLLTAAEDGPRRVADIVNISSVAARVAWANYGVDNMTKFRERLHRIAAPGDHQKRVRFGVVEPGVDTELGSHNSGAMREHIDAFLETTVVLQAEDVADSVVFMVTRPRHASISELWILPTDQA